MLRASMGEHESQALAVLRAASAVLKSREGACSECGLLGEHKMQCGQGGYSRVYANIEGG